MVRKYRVTVAGHAYEVEVEELGAGVASVRSSAQVAAQASAEGAAPAAAPSRTDASASTAAPATAPQPPAAPTGPRPPAKGGVVTSPLPGKVLSVRAQVGQKVKRGDLLLVIEAMKMENEIFCAEAGTVSKVHVSAGQNVETGDLLVELAPGD